MGEVLFKGQLFNSKQWVEGFYFETPLTDGITDSIPEDGWSFLTGKKRCVISRNSCVYQIKPETVCQFTGLSDKNMAKAFENDIVKWGDEIYKIVFKNGTFFIENDVEIIPIGFTTYPTNDGSVDMELESNIKFCEIIGNFHDNPDLLKN